MGSRPDGVEFPVGIGRKVTRRNSQPPQTLNAVKERLAAPKCPVQGGNHRIFGGTGIQFLNADPAAGVRVSGPAVPNVQQRTCVSGRSVAKSTPEAILSGFEPLGGVAIRPLAIYG